MPKKVINNQKKVIELSRGDDSSSSGDSDSDSTYTGSNSDSEKELDMHEYRKLLSELYPSKFMDKKVKAGDKLKQKLKNDVVKKNNGKKQSKTHIKYDEDDDDEYYEEEEEEEEEKPKKKSSHIYNTRNKNKKVKSHDYESESENDSGDETISENDTDSEDGENDKERNEKINITFTINGGEEEYWETCSEEDEDNMSTENEDESVSSEDSDSEENNKDETESDVDIKHNKKTHKETKKEKKNKEDKKSKDDKKEKVDCKKNKKEEKEQLEQTIVLLKEIQEKKKDAPIINQLIEKYETKINAHNKKKQKKAQKQKDKNVRIFKRLANKRNSTDDVHFFKDMDPNHQIKLIKELKEINSKSIISKSYKITLLESTIPIDLKVIAMQKIQMLHDSEPGDNEYCKLQNWVDTFMKIPFDKHSSLPVSITDGVETCHNFMENAHKLLNNAVYGLNDAKMQIMQMLGNLIINPQSIGQSIAIQGPPGTGKTSIVKDGISKILNRPFAFIPLGGATDGAYLEGHSYTYVGSTWGKIIQIIIESKCMNPIIYFDELDKISDSPRGEEITGILTHLTDTAQNDKFHDKYFSDVDFDLSKCLFIFSYNDECKINPILKDRMYKISTKGYNQKQKTIIARNYLLNKIRDQVKFNEDEIIIPDATIHYIIENYCKNDDNKVEDGVRNLKRCLEIIHTKLNLYRLMKPGTNLFEEDMSLKVEFPFTITKDVVDKLIKQQNKDTFSAQYSMYS